jgi:hypothetical protein
VTAGVGAPLNVIVAVKVDPAYGIPVGCASVSKAGTIIAAGVTADEEIDASESPFIFVAFTVNVYAVPLSRPETLSGDEAPETTVPLLTVIM